MWFSHPVVLPALTTLSFRLVHLRNDLSSALLLPEYVPNLINLEILEVSQRYFQTTTLSFNVASQITSLRRLGDLSFSELTWNDLPSYTSLTALDTSLDPQDFVGAIACLPRSVTYLRLSEEPRRPARHFEEDLDENGLRSSFKRWCSIVVRLNQRVQVDQTSNFLLVLSKSVFPTLSPIEMQYWQDLQSGLAFVVALEGGELTTM